MPLGNSVCGGVSSTTPGCLPEGHLRDEVWADGLGCVFHKQVVPTASTGRLGDTVCTSIGDFAKGLDFERKVFMALLEVLGAAAVGTAAVK